MPLLRAALVAAASLTSMLIAGPALAAPDGACSDPTGVTVVVDATEIGGEVVVGCADAPATGTEALQDAGFTDTRDTSGLICAIDAQPDPCPATFEGQYWSYWYAADGTWQPYAEGSDTAVPAAGGVEGWRYSDGSAGPDFTLPAASGTETPAPSGSAVASPSASATDTPSADVTASEGGEISEVAQPRPWPWFAIVAALIAVGLVSATAVVARRRRNS